SRWKGSGGTEAGFQDASWTKHGLMELRIQPTNQAAAADVHVFDKLFGKQGVQVE
ncbi:hypothetical protein K0M31_011387, partial [Melipona bicolor]